MAPQTGSPQPPTPIKQVIDQHDELVRIMDWQPAAEAARRPYWEGEAATYSGFAEDVMDALESAMGGIEQERDVQGPTVSYRPSHEQQTQTSRPPDAKRAE